MREYFKIMFADWDTMSFSDSDKWWKYAHKTFNVLLVIMVLVWLTYFILVVIN